MLLKTFETHLIDESLQVAEDRSTPTIPVTTTLWESQGARLRAGLIRLYAARGIGLRVLVSSLAPDDNELWIGQAAVCYPDRNVPDDKAIHVFRTKWDRLWVPLREGPQEKPCPVRLRTTKRVYVFSEVELEP